MSEAAVQEELEARAYAMNLYPEVLWDRCTEGCAFGWIERDDGRHDFLVLQWLDDGRMGLITSSARYSREFACRAYGEEWTGENHQPCKRVADVFGDLVPRNTGSANVSTAE